MLDVTIFNWQAWDDVQKLFWVIFQIFSFIVFSFLMASFKSFLFRLWAFCFLLCDPRKYLIDGIPERRPQNLLERFGLFLLAIVISCYFGYTLNNG